MTGGSDVPASERPTVTERITIGLTPKAWDELAQLQTATGESKTDLVNRAVSLYAFVTEMIAQGSAVLVRDRETGEITIVHLL